MGHMDCDGRKKRNFSVEKYPFPEKEIPEGEEFRAKLESLDFL